MYDNLTRSEAIELLKIIDSEIVDMQDSWARAIEDADARSDYRLKSELSSKKLSLIIYWLH